MRKKKKQEILELLKTLEAAREVVRNMVASGKISGARDILSECQQAAVAVGTCIEQSEGEGHAAVVCLEEYCEALFIAYEKLGTDKGADEIYEILSKQLEKAETIIKKDIYAKKEVVFFPYKASMWDSLESLYLTLKTNQEYDVYCVPIPYFELNPDRSLGAMHYEGGEYPENIEITDWRAYDLEERRPDEIYIHNGYDDCNLVTSVHPRFYSRNLKQYTDLLVYIPYFVLRETDPEDQVAVDSIKHFVWLPGVIYADKVIVQSEAMKQIYISEYLKAAEKSGLGGRHLDRNYLEQKIDGTGSPKLDRVLRLQREDIEIPEDWKDIIHKADGIDKKIIFYNTSINALLSQDKKMLDKISRVFDIFREYRDEVALLWRPHPLLPSTIRAMRPELWEQYRQIVEQYRREGWGIYDDSVDIDRAVVISDAYYGDESSVVELCKTRRIPVMIQNVNV